MLRFIIRQLFMLLFLCVAIILLTNLGMAGLTQPSASESTFSFNLLRQGVNNSFAYLASLIRGNLGAFNAFNRTVNVSDVLLPAFKNSFGLMGVAMGISALTGGIFGVIITLTKHRPVRLSLLLITIVGISAPSFLAVVLLQQLGIQFNLALGRRLISMAGFEWSLQKMALPVLILATRPTAYITRIVYISLSQILAEDYMRTAAAKGLSPIHRLLRHAFPNLAMQFLSALAISIRFSLSTLILVEFLFAWPGLGRNFLSAIQERQVVLVTGLALTIGLTMLVIHSGLEACYFYLDPRLREER